MRLRTHADIGAAIRERRRKLGLDQRTLAEQMGVSRQWVIEVEKGKPRAELRLVLRALEVLGIALWTEEPAGPREREFSEGSAINLDEVIERHRPRRSRKR